MQSLKGKGLQFYGPSASMSTPYLTVGSRYTPVRIYFKIMQIHKLLEMLPFEAVQVEAVKFYNQISE